jgi:hypothetical protein
MKKQQAIINAKKKNTKKTHCCKHISHLKDHVQKDAVEMKANIVSFM